MVLHFVEVLGMEGRIHERREMLGSRPLDHRVSWLRVRAPGLGSSCGRS